MSLYEQLESVKQWLLSLLPKTMPQSTTEQMVRRVCAEEGMSHSPTEVIVAIIWAESGMKPRAIGKPNKDGTIDYGLCQFNSRWWIGPGKPFPTPEYVLSHPEECVRVMCQHLKKTGRYRDWSAFNNGSYKKYLKA
jgi:Transglycosylase SLT domain